MTFVHRAWRLALVFGLLVVAGSIVAPVFAQSGAVSIVDTSFQPATITVAAGDTVTWTTTQSIGQPHSVTSGTPGGDVGKDFDSGIGLKDNGESYQFTFDTPGTYLYFCQVHPTLMRGQVIVTAAGGASAPPSAAPPASAAPASAAPASAAPASGAPASGAPANPGGPEVTQPPVSPEAGEPLPPENKLIAAGVLGVVLILLFTASWFWRRMNPA
jgi:plastocyanin